MTATAEHEAQKMFNYGLMKWLESRINDGESLNATESQMLHLLQNEFYGECNA